MSVPEIDALLKKDLGLSGWEVQLQETPQGFSASRQLTCRISLDVQIAGNQLDSVIRANWFPTIFKSIKREVEVAFKNTELFQALQSKAEEGLQEKTKEVEDLKAEIERLKKYETHYEMALALASGKEAE